MTPEQDSKSTGQEGCSAETGVGAGWVDPVLASSLGAENPVAVVALQFAWQARGAPEARFGVDTADLKPSMSPLIASRRVQTGKARNSIPSQAQPPTSMSLLIAIE